MRYVSGIIDCGNYFRLSSARRRAVDAFAHASTHFVPFHTPLPAKNVGQVNVGSQLWHIVRATDIYPTKAEIGVMIFVNVKIK